MILLNAELGRNAHNWTIYHLTLVVIELFHITLIFIALKRLNSSLYVYWAYNSSFVKCLFSLFPILVSYLSLLNNLMDILYIFPITSPLPFM